MSMNPWMAEELVASRIEELRRTAHRRIPESPDDPGRQAPGAVRTRPALARRVGVLLIAVGRRLADGDTFPAALEASHRR